MLSVFVCAISSVLLIGSTVGMGVAVFAIVGICVGGSVGRAIVDSGFVAWA